MWYIFFGLLNITSWIVVVILAVAYAIGILGQLNPWYVGGTVFVFSVYHIVFAIIVHVMEKKRLQKIRIDIKGIIYRLKNRNITGDEYAVDDSIDFLNGINESYANEVPLLIRELIDAEEEETINFIIVSLSLIPHSLNEEIVQIISEKINKSITCKTHFDMLEYVIGYLSKQGINHKIIITPILIRIAESRTGLINRFLSFYTLWRWIGFRKAFFSFWGDTGVRPPC